VDLRETFKDLPVGDKTYRLTKMTPRTATWLYAVVSAAAREGEPIVNALGRLTEQEFDQVQTVALKHAFALDLREGIEVPVPALSRKDVAENPAALYELTCIAVLYNLTPFLAVPAPK